MSGKAPADAGHIMGSKHRLAVMRRLAESPAIPKHIKQDTERPYSRVSDALDDLKQRGLVELLVPESERKGRLHGLTDRGESAWTYMIETGMVEPAE